MHLFLSILKVSQESKTMYSIESGFILYYGLGLFQRVKSKEAIIQRNKSKQFLIQSFEPN